MKMVESCRVCTEANGHISGFREKDASKKATRAGEVILVDLCKLWYVSLGSVEHMLVFLDQYSKFMDVPLRNKALAL